MKMSPTALADVKLLEPRVFPDHRGFFFESFNERVFEALLGRPMRFVQDNHSHSRRGVVRGLHYQLAPRAQGKLVRCCVGEVFDVAVDLRRSSPDFGRWVGVHLSAEDKRQLWIPPGFAHGFCVLSEVAELLYKTTDFHAPETERTLAWDDPELGVDWPLPEGVDPILSEKDRRGTPLQEAEVYG
ncbi:MAG: dTDP-4-dehydrorhamnose 3,5-epimerase [Alphaproteobacteria bacterium]|nr:dTDP-4-dehydrorhamnose 3,5-epimerase [Alphaproteobacteria bacterium]